MDAKFSRRLGQSEVPGSLDSRVNDGLGLPKDDFRSRQSNQRYEAFKSQGIKGSTYMYELVRNSKLQKLQQDMHHGVGSGGSGEQSGEQSENNLNVSEERKQEIITKLEEFLHNNLQLLKSDKTTDQTFFKK
jgi:hypothetical protein